MKQKLICALTLTLPVSSIVLDYLVVAFYILGAPITNPVSYLLPMILLFVSLPLLYIDEQDAALLFALATTLAIGNYPHASIHDSIIVAFVSAELIFAYVVSLALIRELESYVCQKSLNSGEEKL